MVVAQRMKILVVVVPNLRLDFLGCYGNDWIETPAIDRFAAEGIVFDQHIADQPDRAGADRAWRTGRYSLPAPSESAATTDQRLLDLFQLLQQAPVPSIRIGHSAESDRQDFVDGLDRTLGRLLERDRWLLWLELDMLRRPAVQCPPMSDAVRLELQDAYGSSIANFDDCMARICDLLTKHRLFDDVMTMLTSDCGVPLGERDGGTDRCVGLHEELIHVPLLVRRPGAAEAGLRVDALTQPVDLLPTLLESFALPSVEAHGLSLWPLLHGGTAPIRAYACSGMRIGGRMEWALRTPDWSLLLTVCPDHPDAQYRPQLYVKPDDRWEVNDVIQHHIERAAQLEKTLRGFVQATRCPGRFVPPPMEE